MKNKHSGRAATPSELKLRLTGIFNTILKTEPNFFDKLSGPSPEAEALRAIMASNATEAQTLTKKEGKG